MAKYTHDRHNKISRMHVIRRHMPTATTLQQHNLARRKKERKKESDPK
jgi:hypothetical protein